MIEHMVEQNTAEWMALRLGIPTASAFSRVITPKTQQRAAAHKAYAAQLIAERLTGQPTSDLSNLPAIQRGNELEPMAVLRYETTRGTHTRKAGFGTTDCRRIGASPDRVIVGQAGGVECKATGSAKHMEHWLYGFGKDDEYKCQYQGQMMVWDWDFVDLYDFHPTLPNRPVRCFRDQLFIDKMRAELEWFVDYVDELYEQVKRDSGFTDDMFGGFALSRTAPDNADSAPF